MYHVQIPWRSSKCFKFRKKFVVCRFCNIISFTLVHIQLLYCNLLLCCPVGWGCTLTASLQRGKTPPPTNECPGNDTKQSDGEVPVILELWGMWSTPSLPLLPGPFWLGMVAPDRALFMG